MSEPDDWDWPSAGDIARGTFLTAWGVVAIVVIVVVAAIVGTAIWLHFQGGFQSQETRNIRHSIGYVDAQNAHCEQDISDYSAAKAAYVRDAADQQAQAADQAHMLALVSDCRSTVGQLSPDEVAAPVAQFLAAHPEG